MKRKFITTGQMLATRRKQVKITQAQLAKALGYSTPQFVSNWERGLCGVPERSFRRISQILGVPMRDMIDHASRDFRHRLNRVVRLS